MTKSRIDIHRHDNVVHINVKNLGIATKTSRRSWTVFCPTLKVLGYSTKSERDALRDFEENLVIFFSVHLKDDTLDDALNNFQWRRRSILVPTPQFDLDNTPDLDSKDFDLELPIAA